MKKRVSSLLLTLALTMSLMLTNLVTITANAAISSFAGGSGTAADPYLISTKTQLSNVRQYPNAHFKLTCNIEFTTGDFASNGSFYNSGKGWLPIGSTSNKYTYDKFTGSFDGNGFAIKNLSVDSPIGVSGLFRYNSGIIKNLYIIDCEIYASHSSSNTSASASAGGIAAENNGTITNCYVTGEVSATASAWESEAYAGGVAGYNRGIITSCYNTATIYGKTYASGSKYSGGNSRAHVGGIAGYSKNEITNCYNTGDISSVADKSTAYSNVDACAYSGGIVGDNDGTAATCYNTSIVTATSNDYARASGIAGSGGSVKNCYFMDKGDGSSASTTGKRTAEELEQQSTYVGFDFENVWTMNPLVQPYPMLKTIHYHIYDSICDSICDECGSSRVAPHSYVWIIDKENNCGVSGIKHEECLVCNATRNNNTTISPTKEHSYDNVCDAICNVCGLSRTASHFYEWVIDKENTCVVEGVKHEECTVCHTKRNENTVIEATGEHTFTDADDTECNVCKQKFAIVWFNTNGGSRIDAIRTFANTSITLPSTSPTRSGYVFTGWSTNINGDIMYKAGASFKAVNSITLYAQWDKKCSVTESVSCTACSGSGEKLGTITCYNCSGSGVYTMYTGCTNGCDLDGYIMQQCTYCKGTKSVRLCRTCSSGGTKPIAQYNCVIDNHDTYYGLCYKCNSDGQMRADCPKCEGGSVASTKTCSWCSGLGKETGYITCSTCSGDGTVQKTCTKCNGSGILIRKKVSAPSTPVLKSITLNTIELQSISNGEYSLNGTSWQDSPIFTDLTDGQAYTFFQRYAKTDTTYASAASNGLKVTFHNHTYDNDCDTTCNICNEIRSVTHTYDGSCDIQCNLCLKTRSTGVAHTYDNACDAVCNICYFERSSVMMHTYDNACDSVCNSCGWVRSTPNHIYDNACDPDCNVCNVRREIVHDYADATCEMPKICKVCEKVDGNPLGHSYGKATCTNAEICEICGDTKGEPLGHDYDSGVVTKAETCNSTGIITYTCGACGNKITKAIPMSTIHTYSNNCDAQCNVCKATRTITHAYKTTPTKATLTKNGSIVKKCTVCGKVASNTAIKYAKTFILSRTTYTYDGKVKAPSVTVKDSAGKTLKKNADYTVTYASGRKNAGTYKVTIKMIGKYSGTKTLTFKINPAKISSYKLSATTYTYDGKVKKPTVTAKNSSGTKLTTSSYTVTYASGRKNVGTYKVTIKGKGNYTGAKTLTFKINPTKTTVSKLTAGKKSITVAITKKSTQVTGYQIQHSTSKTFSKATTKTISSYKSTKYTLKSLSAKKTYYVRVRTYKKVGSTTYYSGWSTCKYVKTK